MDGAAHRVRAFRERRRADGYREIRLYVPDARSAAVRARIADQVARLDRADEDEAMAWIESVSELDNEDPDDAPR